MKLQNRYEQLCNGFEATLLVLYLFAFHGSYIFEGQRHLFYQSFLFEFDSKSFEIQFIFDEKWYETQFDSFFQTIYSKETIQNKIQFHSE